MGPLELTSSFPDPEDPGPALKTKSGVSTCRSCISPHPPPEDLPTHLDQAHSAEAAGAPGPTPGKWWRPASSLPASQGRPCTHRSRVLRLRPWTPPHCRGERGESAAGAAPLAIGRLQRACPLPAARPTRPHPTLLLVIVQEGRRSERRRRSNVLAVIC